MPRPRNVIPTAALCLMLPEDLRGWLDLHLFSDVEGRVPQGAYQSFFVRKIREEMEHRRLDTGVGIVQGPKEAITLLSKLIHTEDSL